MTKYFTNSFPVVNLYKKSSINSEVVSQMIYGESFSIIKRSRKWLKIKIKEDNYKGFIQNKIFYPYLKPTHKINILKAKIYKFPYSKKLTELTFNSKIRVTDKKSNFLKFEKGWINKNDVKIISYKEKNLFRKINIFKNIKYKWGGKSFRGIDCSGLIQIFLNFNNKFCPRDAKDQIKYFKKNIILKNIKKNDIIYWKGHVAVALSKKELIHAYGPMKKTVIMGINQTIEKIEQTAKLKVLGVRKI